MDEVKRIWELKQSVDDPAILNLYIYDYIEGDGYDWWTGEIIESETSAKHFKQELAKYPDVTQINLFVNSYGGYVYEAMAIRNQLKRHSAKVVGIVDGFACSAASFVLTACDEIKMYSNTMQMIHEIRTGIYGNSKELRKAADDNDIIMQGNRQAYLEKADGKITDEKLKELMEEETWLTAQQCLEYGLCDEIIGQEVDLAKAKEMLQKVNRTFEQQLSYNKALVAQYQEFKQSLDKEPAPEPEPVPAVPAEPEPAPEPEPEPEPALNKPKQLFTALFGQRKDED